MFVVAEEPGTGLGARCAGTTRSDPGREVGRRATGGAGTDRQPVGAALGGLDRRRPTREFDRSVVAGEADGRWLWLVLRPASAMLLLRDDWILRDVSGIGPPLVEMAFGGPSPAW